MQDLATEISSATWALSAKWGRVTLPEPAPQVPDADFDRGQARTLLEGLGKDLGMSILSRLSPDSLGAGLELDTTSLFPEEALRGTLERFDVVWLNGTDVVAVFALESDPTRSQGPARFADLLALNPKNKASLYAVTTPAAKSVFESELHRPAHRLLKKSLAESVRILDWSRLATEIGQLGDRVRYLKAEFLEGISELSLAA